MFKKFVSAAILVAPLAACVTTVERPNTPPTDTLRLQSRADKPIHIGDGRGNLSDFAASDRAASPAAYHKWTFNLKVLPKAAVAKTTMFSLTSGCPTLLEVNGQTVRDLSSGFTGLGAVDETEANIPVAILRVGENAISIVERKCATGGMNDSLIRELVVTTY